MGCFRGMKQRAHLRKRHLLCCGVSLGALGAAWSPFGPGYERLALQRFAFAQPCLETSEFQHVGCDRVFR